MGYKLYLLLVLICLSFMTLAQTGIGTTTPNASAKLDVYSTNKGFLPPRVTLTSVTDATTIASPAEGLLVYNLGSVGLQAGYYYWNGANWATIATATSAGNGVTSMDMVKLYGEAHSSATGKISSSTGYVFTVPVSGRYLFDFTSTGTFLSGGMTIYYFQVRQGTTVLGSDMQTSYNNNVHVEYNGKVEVNLQAGVSYNVYNYTTGGSFESNDFDRVYYKLVAGNLPVTGQTVDYAMASLSANQSITAASNILFNTIQGAGITLNNGGFNLIANKTYKLEGAVGGSSTGYIYYAWVDASNTIITGGSVGSVMKAGVAYTDGPQDKAVAYYTPTTNTTVYLRVLSIAGTSVAYPAAASPTYSSTWASINQIGSSAMINPWILSGTSTSNTTGNVGIGTNAPTEKLEVSGNVKATNFLGTATSALSAPTNITFGEIDVPQNLAIGTGFVDLVNIPLPSAGKYKITYVVRASVTTSGTLAVLLLRNGSSTQIIGTEAMAIYNAASVQVTCTQVSIVTTTAAETYKLSSWTQTGGGNLNVINDGNGRSKVLWEKIQ
jgi:uncharacterized protein YdeI (BOF family)